MKIALCFSGQLRFVNEYHTFILENIIKLYDVDIYAHFWWNEDMLNKSFHHEYNDLYKENIGDFIKLYSPKKIKVDKKYSGNSDNCIYKSCENHMYLDEENCKRVILTMKSQFYSVLECYNLIENADDYDFIIRLRTDCYISAPLHLHDLNKHTLYIQNSYCAGQDRKYCDWFAVGNNSVMNEYSNIYNKINSIFKEGVIHIHNFMEKATSHINRIDYEFNVPIYFTHNVFKFRK
jgi:hypothetical protein